MRSTCLSACLLVSGTTLPNFAKFLCMLSAAVVRSSSGGVAIREHFSFCERRQVCRKSASATSRQVTRLFQVTHAHRIGHRDVNWDQLVKGRTLILRLPCTNWDLAKLQDGRDDPRSNISACPVTLFAILCCLLAMTSWQPKFSFVCIT